MTRRTLTFGTLQLSLVSAAFSTSDRAQTARLRVSDIDTIVRHNEARRGAYGTDSLQFGELGCPKDAVRFQWPS